eukprot:GEMP01002691.1.p1 GENE.GEMP01002691.1~~GEMP01002691.1.p1  ORF type:complete len:761 (+),score=170.30 GEMP01002691.1:194-2476(+)
MKKPAMKTKVREQPMKEKPMKSTPVKASGKKARSSKATAITATTPTPMKASSTLMKASSKNVKPKKAQVMKSLVKKEPAVAAAATKVKKTSPSRAAIKKEPEGEKKEPRAKTKKAAGVTKVKKENVDTKLVKKTAAKKETPKKPRARKKPATAAPSSPAVAPAPAPPSPPPTPAAAMVPPPSPAVPASSSSAPANDVKIVKKVLKGSRLPVDDFVPGKEKCRVYEDTEATWGCMLNQSNVCANNNKFYVIQLLQKDGGNFVVWTRWGRVGVPGQNNALQCGSLLHAKSEFQNKFTAKTGVPWARRLDARPKAGKYAIIEMDYEVDEPTEEPPEDRIQFSMDLTADAIQRVLSRIDGNSDTLKSDVELSKSPVAVVIKGSRVLSPSVEELRKVAVSGTLSVQFDRPDESQANGSSLHPAVQDLVKRICDLNMMTEALVEIGYDAKKMPLGKISSAMINAGFRMLQAIAAELKGQHRESELERLTGEFFTVIPHDIGFKKMREFTISTDAKLKDKIVLVESLKEIEIAHKLLTRGGKGQQDKNPIDKHYEDLYCGLKALTPGSSEWTMVETYAQNTHGSTHGQYKLKMKSLFAVDKPDGGRFSKFRQTPNRQLLWHGSRLTNWVGILSQGLRIAPPEAPVSGYMFGKGVYFADCVSKSANYCSTSREHNRGLLLLCEVALGEMNEKIHADYHANNLPSGKLSTKGLGRIAPMSDVNKDGLTIPLGKIGETKVPNATLWYNEFIVYDTDQIRPAYLCDFEFVY